MHELCISNKANLVAAQTIVTFRLCRVTAIISREIVVVRNIFVNDFVSQIYVESSRNTPRPLSGQ